MTSTRTAAGIASPAIPAVRPHRAGLCVEGQHHRDADAMLLRLADQLETAGCAAHLTFTHQVSGERHTRIACSLHWLGQPGPGTVDDLASRIWAALSATAVGAGRYLDFGETRGDGPAELVEAAQRATLAAISRSEGRAVVFPGSRDLTGTMSVQQLLGGSAIDSVSALANGVVLASDMVDTRDFVRPVFRDSGLELLVQPAAGGVFVPFEFPNPTPCCADHDGRGAVSGSSQRPSQV